MAPNYKLPFPAGTVVSIQTYRGHNPDDKKMDMYAVGWPQDSKVVAAAAGTVHEHFDPGGIEINHGGGHFTTYMHMSERAPVGRKVEQGEWVGKAGSVGTGAKHLHHEQLFAGKGSTDADTRDIIRPTIQGVGPIKLVPGKPISMTSTNSPAGKPTPGPKPPKNFTIESPFPYWKQPGHVVGLKAGPARYHGGANATEQLYVRTVVDVLRKLGYNLPMTSTYTTKVESQVRHFQMTRMGMPRAKATGQVGLGTWRALRKAWRAR